jgi:transposase
MPSGSWSCSDPTKATWWASWWNQPYNGYWPIDALMEEGYQVHLANPSAIQKYSGLKHADDQHDAFRLAELLRLGILPEGYIYPKEERPIRDR